MVSELDNHFLNAHEHLARLLGISEFRLQHHGDTFVDHAWHADVWLAFHGAASVGVARAVDISQEPWRTVWFRAAIVLLSDSGAVVASENGAIQEDYVLGADAPIRLFDSGDTVSRDGVSYTFFVPRYSGSTTLQFANPASEPFKQLESGLLRISQTLASKSADEHLLAFVSNWKTYCKS